MTPLKFSKGNKIRKSFIPSVSVGGRGIILIKGDSIPVVERDVSATKLQKEMVQIRSLPTQTTEVWLKAAPVHESERSCPPSPSLQAILIDRNRLTFKLFDDIIEGIIRDRGELLEVLGHFSLAR